VTLHIDVANQVATLTLNRPEAMNSIDPETRAQLHAAWRRIKEDDEIRVVILTGAGEQAFCTGSDLKKTMPPKESFAQLTFGSAPPDHLLAGLDTDKPLICAVNGVAAGAGANIPLACDLVLAARSARFIQAFCKIGLIPDSGGTFFLPRLVGMARAKALTLLGEPLSAEDALQWGLIYRVVDDNELRTEALKLARHLATQPTYGLALIKQSLNASVDNHFEQQIELERDLQRLAGRSEDYREGVDAFMHKRTPVFKGR